MTPIEHLWRAAGRPDPNWQGKARTPKTPPAPRPGVCALTGIPGDVWPLTKITTTLTTLDRFPHRDQDPAGIALGPAAAWAVRHRDAMLRPHGIDPTGRHRPLEGPDLYDALVRAATDPTVMASVPVGQFPAQILPWAQWGHIGTDTGWWPWGTADIDRLGTYQALRRLGFGETAITEPEPRFALLQRAPVQDRIWVLRHWHDLDPWRTHPAYLPIAARATRTTKETC